MPVTTKVAYLNEVKNIHICLVAISLSKGGAERAVAAQSQMWHDMGARVTIVLLNHDFTYAYAGQIWSPLKTGVGYGMMPRWSKFKQLRVFLSQERPDVVIDHRPKNNILKELIYKKWLYRGLSLIYVTHSAHVPMYLTQFPKVFAQLCQSNRANIGVSEWIKNEILDNYGLKNTHYIPNSIAPAWSGYVPQEAPSDERPYVLWYGRLDDQVKDLSLLIEAFSLSEAGKSSFDLRIMGQGPDKESLQEKSLSLGCSDRIIFMEFQPDPRPIVAGAQAVLLTSFFEGFPMVLIEALSLSTPVVAIDINSGPSEIIQDQHNGLLVGQRNSRIFAQAIDRMCLDREFHQLCCDHARASVQHFAMEHVAKHWKALLDHD